MKMNILICILGIGALSPAWATDYFATCQGEVTLDNTQVQVNASVFDDGNDMDYEDSTRTQHISISLEGDTLKGQVADSEKSPSSHPDLGPVLLTGTKSIYQGTVKLGSRPIPNSADSQSILTLVGTLKNAKSHAISTTLYCKFAK